MSGVEFCDLSSEDKRKLEIGALKWYEDHKKHVKRMLKDKEYNYPPSGSDLFHPELWKSGHWNWFDTWAVLKY